MSQETDINKLLYEFTEYRNDMKGWFGAGNKSAGNKPDKDAEKVASSFDKSTGKIVAALGVLNSSVLASSKTEIAKKRELEKFINKVIETTDTVEKLEKAVDDARKAAEDAAEAKKKQDADEKEAKRKAARTTEQIAKEDADEAKKKREDDKKAEI